MNPTILLTVTMFVTTSLITGSLIFVSIPKASARNAIDDPTLQFSPAAQSNAKPCKNCPSFQMVQRNGPTITIPVESQRTTTALESGELATGGGYTADVPVVIEVGKALPNNEGWTITAHNGFGVNVPLTASAYAECATIVP
jgi:hypothetical protein